MPKSPVNTPYNGKFQKALQFRRFQDVVQQIQEAILQGHMSKGDMLPSERELKERFGISRGTLREALRVLEDRGLIEIKSGNQGGIFVRKLTTEQASNSLAILIRSQVVSLVHLAQFRQSVEGDIAAAAAQKAAAEDIQQLKELAGSASAYLDPVSPSKKEFFSIDQQFHIQLARISGNPVHLFVMQSIHANILRYYDQFLQMDQAHMHKNIQFFYDLIQAIERRQINEARILAQAHVLQFNLRMQALQDQEKCKGNKPEDKIR